MQEESGEVRAWASLRDEARRIRTREEITVESAAERAAQAIGGGVLWVEDGGALFRDHVG